MNTRIIDFIHDFNTKVNYYAFIMNFYLLINVKNEIILNRILIIKVKTYFAL